MKTAEKIFCLTFFGGLVYNVTTGENDPRHRAAGGPPEGYRETKTMSDQEIMEALADLAAEFESCGTYEPCEVDPWEGCDAFDLEALAAFCGVDQ